MRTRPRRALKAPIGVRVARIAGPAVAAGALITTVAVTAWPTAGVEATPQVAPSAFTLAPSAAPSASASLVSEALRAATADRADRSQARPTLSESDEKAAMLEDAELEAGKKQAAADKKAAAKKAAEELQDSIIGTRYTTSEVKLRTKPAKDAKSVDIIDEAKKLKVTDTVKKGFRLVVVDDKGRWVTNEYLSKKKPSADELAGISNASCGKSGSIESGLVANGKKAYRAMCAAFPEVRSFGGRRSSNDFHGSGQAIDAMISDSTAGWKMANWVRANASKLGVSEVIYAQKIWTVQRSGEGWRGMSDRGSATANHYDHVHVSVY